MPAPGIAVSMAIRRKQSKKQQLKTAARKLTQDQQVQAQLRIAAKRLDEARTRVSGRSAQKVASDKKLYAKLREAATALTTAGRSLRAEPEPPKRRGRLLAIAGAATAAAVVVKRRRSGAESTPAPADAGVPFAAPTPAASQPQSTG